MVLPLKEATQIRISEDSHRALSKKLTFTMSPSITISNGLKSTTVGKLGYGLMNL
ncbi:hypothetical protein BT69DRAFT_1344055 [Atractiella rhizophila]|nr:hypothetical protein BT69DRAFT_1344055 [Atractiella rhizophila]